MKEEREKPGLKLDIKKLTLWHLVPSLPWQIEGEKMEALTDFLFLASKITMDCDCSHEIRRQFLLGRKAMTNLDSVIKAKTPHANRSLYSQGYTLSKSHVCM